MNQPATIVAERVRRRPNHRAAALRLGDWRALVRKVLDGTRLIDRVVASLFKGATTFEARDVAVSSFLLLKPTQTLMLAGIRCAGAGGGGPGRCPRDGMSDRHPSILHGRFEIRPFIPNKQGQASQ